MQFAVENLGLDGPGRGVVLVRKRSGVLVRVLRLEEIL